MENIIEIKNLQKRFGDVVAVNDLTFRVKKGEFFAFLGENGAGKSTTISIMCGQLGLDGGNVVIDGFDVTKDIDKIKREIGVVFQNSYLDKPLSVRENLRCRAGLYGIFKEDFEKRLKELDEYLGFGEYIDRPYGKLSGGQRRKIDIARAIIHDPKILIMDEPTTGLDPQTRKVVWEVVSKLREKGITVFLTTHYMEEASDADYIVILDKGSICAEGTPLELKNKYTGDFVTFYNCDEESVKATNLPYQKIGGAFRVSVEKTNDVVDLITKFPKLFADFEVVKGKMDDVFINVTGKKLGDEAR